MSSIVPKIRSLWLKGQGKRVVPVLAIVFLLAFVGVLIYFFHDVESLERLKDWGYLGIFLVTLISSCTVIFPVPGELVVIAAAAIWHPLLIGIVASVGGALGELTGYAAGYWGQAVIKAEHGVKYERAEFWLKRYGVLAIFLFALLPFLLFDLLGIAAGALRYPIWKFLLACWAGRLIRSVAEAYLGATLFALLPIWAWAIIIVAALFILVFTALRLR